jgi:hypothetical protein
METSPIGVFVKDRGATFASIEALHLIALAVLGGAVMVSDLRIMNVLFNDIPSKAITDSAHRWFKVSLTVLLITGGFMMTGVAGKLAVHAYFWIKMLALAVGIVFAFAIKQPLLRMDHDKLQPLTLKMVGLASLSIWFLVAASGRWIGFSEGSF